ncbi:MAG: hypothetical protein CMA86_00250 [Euryarchaeota archaeon]|nr:hypothetical protein [Euryarchaeota archaeon]|tara:strand:- start:91 stop:2481 length:2391 start_codon:yes stop_codon:yes gene_type:complete
MEPSVRNVACLHNDASDETEKVCEWCRSIINYQPNKGWNIHLLPSEHEQTIALFGGPKIPSQQRWRNLLRNLQHSRYIGWAQLEHRSTDPIDILPCSEEEWVGLADTVREGNALSVEQELWLQQGVTFVDGSVLRQFQDTWFLNDVSLRSLSREVVMPVLADRKKRCGWNIPGILLGLNACAPMNNEVFGAEVPLFQQHRIRHPMIRSHYRPLASMLVWLSSQLQLDRTVRETPESHLPMMAWAHDIQRRLFMEQQNNLFDVFSNALAHHPPGLFEAYQMPWMLAWQSLEDTNRHPRTMNWAVQPTTRRLNFRVRSRNGKTRLIRVPSKPDAWALMISLALSPLNSEAGKLLLALQHNWSVPYLEPTPPSGPLLKSLEFCHQIMNGLHENVHLERATALVFGQLGHAYEIKVGRGQHGAPYSIKHVNGLNGDQKSTICIHSGHYVHNVPLGDTMGGVLLSMVNDVKAAENIQSLEEILLSSPPFGFPSEPKQPWLATLNQGALRDIRRWHGAYDENHWFREAQQLPVSDERNEDLHGSMPGFMRWRNRRRFGGRIQRGNAHWHDRFKASFDASGTFPYGEFVAEWRTTVREFVPSNNEFQGEFFGRRMERMMRRYHQVMPHRRGDDLHEQGDVRDGERRWCEVFARVWEVLMMQPLGSYIHVPRRQGNVLSVEHTGLRVTLRNALERTFVGQIARLLGYVTNGENETHRTYIRRDHPRPDARLRLTDLLRTTQERQGIRGAPPRWWNYVDVCAPPHEMGDVRWELQVDLTDNPRRHLEGHNINAQNLDWGLRNYIG